tara:strand:- start:3808 stop:5088 length:1281 start_codon:yes stop_codon:yes gene_type:complete
MPDSDFLDHKGRKRIVITGLGPVSSIGIGIDEYFDGLATGKNGVSLLEGKEFDAMEHPERDRLVAAQIKDFDIDNYLKIPKIKRRSDRFSQFALVGAYHALSNANLLNDEDKYSLRSYLAGVFLGVGIGGETTVETNHIQMLEKGFKGVSPFLISNVMSNAAPGNISIEFGINGPAQSIATACATSSYATVDAIRAIRSGDIDVAITGGVDACITPLVYSGFITNHALSEFGPTRPFDKERDGFVIGEGAGIYIIESLEHAFQRDAPILAEIVGYGLTSDGKHITNIASSGINYAMVLAMNEGDISKCKIDYINAHGTSTPNNDKSESFEIESLFTDYLDQIFVSSTKSQIGHTVAAAGGLETIACVWAILNNQVPPNLNYKTPDPEINVRVPTTIHTPHEIKVVLNNSLGFGGHNACLAIKQYKP